VAFQHHCYGRIREDWVDRFLEDYRISPRSMMRELSRGQQQMVGLILAVAVEPDLLLLDEPAAGLDPVARRELLGAVLELMGDRQSATLITSHILSNIERIVDRVGFLAEGRIVLEGTLDDLKERCALVRLEAAEGVPEGITVLRTRRDGSALVSGDLSRLPSERRHALSLEDLYVELLRDE
jgi:ABC-2 type transport system ATP-binding protein